MVSMSSQLPTIIAIETSTELASVALLHRGQLQSRESSGVLTHSAAVLPLLQRLLADAGITVADCDALAFGSGPGSFTGVRTACGLVQGLAIGADRMVVPVVTLLAMAESARAAGAGDDVITVLDARMGEVYWARFRYDGEWQTISEPVLAQTAEVMVAQGRPAVCGNALLAYPDGFKQLHGLTHLPEIVPHASAVAQLAVCSLARGESVTARDAQPLYLRNKVALTTSERMAAAAVKVSGNTSGNTSGAAA
jgi:tRNA threonylcarbamoyladenosine biosynthesis protein TsaB